MRDSYLFNPDDTAIKPDRKRPEPAVWIERLVVVDARAPDTSVRRDVSFRRGLNIVRTRKRRPDDTRTVGHSVGKTLLTRLIRYVLGESSFAPESVRRKIQFALPSAYVIARVFVGGQSWIAARPIGQDSTSRSWAVRSDCWEDVLGDAAQLGKYSAFAGCQECARRLADDIEQLEKRLTADRRRATRARTAYVEERDRVRTSIAGALQAIGRCDYQLEQASEYQDAWNELDKAQRRLESLDKKATESQEQQKQARESLKRRRQRLSRYFDTTLKALVSQTATGKIRLDGRGLHAEAAGEIADSGEAIGTFATVLGLDLACLIGSICGIGHTPRLLIHDSPREADSEPEMYHQLFNHVAWLEALFGDQPRSFQYIVTTTTQPPADLAKKPYVCVTLHARDEDGLLFRKTF